MPSALPNVPEPCITGAWTTPLTASKNLKPHLHTARSLENCNAQAVALRWGMRRTFRMTPEVQFKNSARSRNLTTKLKHTVLCLWTLWPGEQRLEHCVKNISVTPPYRVATLSKMANQNGSRRLTTLTFPSVLEKSITVGLCCVALLAPGQDCRNAQVGCRLSAERMHLGPVRARIWARMFCNYCTTLWTRQRSHAACLMALSAVEGRPGNLRNCP